jgi:hypothetical protein
VVSHVNFISLLLLISSVLLPSLCKIGTGPNGLTVIRKSSVATRRLYYNLIN